MMKDGITDRIKDGMESWIRVGCVAGREGIG